jgi:hypothetical protein
MLVVVDSPSDPVPAPTRTIFNIAELVTGEKRCGLRNLHLVDLMPDSLWPLPFHLHGSRAIRAGYLFRVPALAHGAPRVSMLLTKATSQALSAQMPAGLKAAELAATDLARLQAHFMHTEMRSEAWWQRFLATYDVTQQYSSAAANKAVDVPLKIAARAREDVILLVRSAALGPAGAVGLPKLTLTQLTEQGKVVGGSTFVFRARKPQ